MEIVKNEFVLPSKDVHIFHTLNYEYEPKSTSIIILKNSTNFMLFVCEEHSKIYTTELFYNGRHYTLVFEFFKEDMPLIYFDSSIPKITRDEIMEKMLTFIDVKTNCQYAKLESNFLKIIYNLKYKIYTFKSTNIEEYIDDIRDFQVDLNYKTLKERLDYRFDLNKSNFNLDKLNGLLLYNENKYVIKPDFSFMDPWDNVVFSKVIPYYCLQYIPEIQPYLTNEYKQTLIDEYDDVYIKFGDDVYSIYETNIIWSNLQTLFKFDNKYIIGSKYIDDLQI